MLTAAIRHRRSRRRSGLSALLALVVSTPVVAGSLELTITDRDGRALREAAVMVDWAGSPATPADPPSAKIIQQNMQFVPHVLPIPRHTSVHFPNLDSTRHHVYSFSPTKTFDIKLYVGSPERPIEFNETGVVPLGCNIHDDMLAFIVVTDAPRMAVTDREGRVRFEDIPADTAVNVEIWQEWIATADHYARRRVAAGTAAATLAVAIEPPPAPPRRDNDSLQSRFDRLAQ